jgi:DNA modification methylase
VYHARCTIWKDPVIEMQRTKALGLLYKQLKKDSSRSRVGMPDYMLFFRKDEPNPDPITHDPEDLPVSMWQELASPVWMRVNQTNVLNGRQARGDQDERHICPLQLDTIERCITLYSNPGDVVMDPFNGIGSTGYQAVKMGRKYVGIELKPEYARQAAKFLEQAEGSAATLFDLEAA